MNGRFGVFWDALEGRATMPRASVTLGSEFVDADVEKGTIAVAFAATGGFTSPKQETAGSTRSTRADHERS